MMRLVHCIVILGIFSTFVQAGGNTLVLLDSLTIKETHSIFFKSLQDRGYTLTFKLADDQNLVLTKYGEHLYENLILFAPSVVEFGGTLNTEEITSFVDDGGNLLYVVGETPSEALRELAGECGFELAEAGAYVIDHHHYDVSDEGHHTKIIASSANLINASVIVGKKDGLPPLLYRGIGILTNADNPLALPLLTADSTAYSYIPNEPIKHYPHVVGKNVVLLGALQARNNARIVVAGSLDFFSNEYFMSSVQNVQDKNKAIYEKSGNEEVAIAISKWVFKEHGVLRATSAKHRKVGASEPPAAYTIMDDVIYQIKIELLVDGVWKPYNADDVQLEFVRIDPFVRTTLKQKTGGGIYEARFKIPDVYGVYQFKVNYDRVGYTQLYSTIQVSVRPLEHTQYERFIPSAYPYYISSFSMMLGMFIFSFVFLHYKEDTPKGKTE